MTEQAAGKPLTAERGSGVQLRGVNYEYQANEAVASTITVGKICDVSLQVKPGEVALLCGASGSGKSTVLRTINGLAPQFHGGELTGSITVAGHDMAKVELHDVCALSATVFQNPRTQFFTTDVRSEMALPLENLARDPQLIRERIADIAQRSGISWALERTLASLSGGQLQRVACACAMVMDVPVILFDEPTSNLDTNAIVEFAGMLQLLKDAGAAIVVAEHRLHFLQGIADRVYRLEAGAIVEEFAADDFFALSSQQRRERGLRSLHPHHPELPAPHGEGLHIRNLQFAYGDNKVLDLKDASFPKGKITIVSGVNGAGKTTLARLICGLAEPQRGAEFSFNGQKLSTRKRNHLAAIVMQDARRQLFAETVREEVRLGQEAICDESAAAQLLQRLDLSACEHSHPLATSGGQQQRLVIAAALASRRPIMIFDEPTSGVDYRQLQSIASLLRELAAAGTVVIVITHDPELMSECGDFELLLEKLTPETR